MTPQDPEHARIENAVTAWSRSVFSAPRRLTELVTGVEARDEIVERVATHVVRRQLREVRAATSERRTTRARIERDSVDPFAYTHDGLQVDSEHIAPCSACDASGLQQCGPCRGTGHGSCPSCHGSGKERSAKTGRPIKCKSCKATGVAPCRNCAGRGSVHCQACLGSGHQIAWLTFEQSERWEISTPADSPLVIAHRALREARPMSADDVAAMTVVVERTANGPIEPGALDHMARQVVHAQLAQIDRRLERVQFQQYLRLAALRRDVTFEMCGARATLSLTGSQLLGATTPEAVRPIKRRLYAWLALCGAVGLAGALLRSSALGSSSYFRAANNATGWLSIAAVACAVPALGAILRSWRGGLRFHPIRRATVLWSAASLAALASIAVVGLTSRPEPSEVQRALAIDDLALARAVVEALAETGVPTADLEDRVALAEAGRRSGADRLKLLDAVAARKGADAASAAATASALRLDQVRQLVASQHPADALVILDQFFGDDRSAPVAEERARAHDAALAACTSIACQLRAASLAHTARTTPTRAAAADAARARALAVLDPAQVDAKPVLPRLQQLRQMRDAATAIAGLDLGDTDLRARTRRAIEFADTERAAVPLLGNGVDVAEELLASSSQAANDIRSIALDGVTVFLALDRKGRCTGVYAVGSKPFARRIQSGTWPPARLLSQALGRPSKLQLPRPGQTTARWYDGGIPIVARGDPDVPLELRIGDATP